MPSSLGWTRPGRPRLHRMPLTYATVAPGTRLPAPTGARDHRAARVRRPARPDASPGRRSRTPRPSSGCGSRPDRGPGHGRGRRRHRAGRHDRRDRRGRPRVPARPRRLPLDARLQGASRSRCARRVNEVICHGIPDARRLEDGDIVNIDITAYIGGVHGDTDATYLVGDVDEESRLLVERTHEAMMRGIRAALPGSRDQRHRPGHPVLRPPVRLRRGPRLHRARHRHERSTPA